jgi:hypothetical protein
LEVLECRKMTLVLRILIVGDLILGSGSYSPDNKSGVSDTVSEIALS